MRLNQNRKSRISIFDQPLIPSDRQFIRDWSRILRCHRCLVRLGNSPIKEAGPYKFYEQCFTCLVCNKGFQGGEKLKRDEWGGLVHSNHFHGAKYVILVQKYFTSNAFV